MLADTCMFVWIDLYMYVGRYAWYMMHINMYALIYICWNASIYSQTCMYMYTCVYVCMQIYMMYVYLCVYIDMHVCMYL